MVGGLIYGAIIGLLIGRAEAHEVWSRICLGDRKKLPHLVVLAIRAAFVALAVLLMGLHWKTSLLAWAGIMAVLTIVHRVAFNGYCRKFGVSRTREWYYMGSVRRFIDDSWYDTLWWIASARQITRHRTDGGRWYLLIRPRFYAMPWLLATLFEAAIATIATLLVHSRL